MHELEKLKIPRCYKPEGFGEIKAVEVHHFSDASLAGYGQCSYLRLLNKDNQAYCSFLMGKARVAPLKFITVPRLELQAAVVSIKISQWLLKELDYQDVSEFFWTDSRVVIGYINNETKHFHTFLANRIQQIHDHTSPQEWQYIESKSNPADCACRGLTAHQLVEDDSRWLTGPNFLWSLGAYQTEVEENLQPLDSDDPEVKRASLVTQRSETHPVHFEISRLDRYSDWFRAKRAIAVCLRLKQRLKEGKEFLQTLQLRKKWVKPQLNMLVGNIVMLKDENAPRNMWKLARVEDVFTSEDGLVGKMKLAIATRSLDKRGRRIDAVHYLERPVHKLVVIQESDREFPDEELR